MLQSCLHLVMVELKWIFALNVFIFKGEMHLERTEWDVASFSLPLPAGMAASGFPWLLSRIHRSRTGSPALAMLLCCSLMRGL